VADSPDKPGGEVLSSLPSTRPQRRSARRDGAKAKKAAPRAKATKASARAKPRSAARSKAGAAKRKPAAVRPSAATKAAGKPPADRPAEPPQGVELVGTALQAAGELAQLGLELGTRALAGAVRRLPRP
jgi:hypothetical protein